MHEDHEGISFYLGHFILNHLEENAVHHEPHPPGEGLVNNNNNLVGAMLPNQPTAVDLAVVSRDGIYLLVVILLTNYLDVIKIINIIKNVAVDMEDNPESVFTRSKINSNLSRAQRERLEPIIEAVLTALRKRAIIIKLDNIPRYHLVQLDHVNLDSLESIVAAQVYPEDRLNLLENQAVLAKLCLNLGNPSRSEVMTQMASGHRESCFPLIDTFLAYFNQDSVQKDDLNVLLLQIRNRILANLLPPPQ